MKTINNCLQHKEKIFCKSNWDVTKSILDDSIENKISPILTLDLTDACNYNCSYCIDKNVVKERENREIDWRILSNLLVEMKEKGCRCLEISGGGEPMLYSHFEDVIILATKLGYRLALITNGSRLYKYISVLKSAPFDWIRVSLDASNDTTYSKLHGIDTGYFSGVIDSVGKLADFHAIGISFLVTSDNVSEIYEAAKIAKRSKARYFEIKPLTENYKASEYTDRKYINLIKKQLSLAEGLSDFSFQIIVPTTMDNWFKQKDEKKNYKKCLAAYYRTVLTPSGIYICPNHRGNNFCCDVPKNVEQMIEYRNREINRIEPLSQCNSFCSRSTINTTLYNIGECLNVYPELVQCLGWPSDYGNDVEWM